MQQHYISYQLAPSLAIYVAASYVHHPPPRKKEIMHDTVHNSKPSLIPMLLLFIAIDIIPVPSILSIDWLLVKVF